MGLEKNKVLDIFIKTQENKIQNLKKSLETMRQGAIDAPGSNVSHSDTSKFQLSNLALGIESSLIDVQKALNSFIGVQQMDFQTVYAGCLLTIRDSENKITVNYLLIPEGGGDSFEVDGEKIMAISITAPLAQALIGASKGDKIKFRDKVFDIVDIQ